MVQNKQYKIEEHVKYELESEFGISILIIPIENGVPDMRKVLCLKDTSLFIWELISENYNCDQIISKVSEEYSKEIEAIEYDVKEFINTLILKNYISVVE